MRGNWGDRDLTSQDNYCAQTQMSLPHWADWSLGGSGDMFTQHPQQICFPELLSASNVQRLMNKLALGVGHYHLPGLALSGLGGRQRGRNAQEPINDDPYSQQWGLLLSCRRYKSNSRISIDFFLKARLTRRDHLRLGRWSNLFCTWLQFYTLTFQPLFLWLDFAVIGDWQRDISLCLVCLIPSPVIPWCDRLKLIWFPILSCLLAWC